MKNNLNNFQKFLENVLPILKFRQMKEKMYLTCPLTRISSHGAKKQKTIHFNFLRFSISTAIIPELKNC
jgi:hypothetical protein